MTPINHTNGDESCLRCSPRNSTKPELTEALWASSASSADTPNAMSVSKESPASSRTTWGSHDMPFRMDANVPFELESPLTTHVQDGELAAFKTYAPRCAAPMTAQEEESDQESASTVSSDNISPTTPIEQEDNDSAGKILTAYSPYHLGELYGAHGVYSPNRLVDIFEIHKASSPYRLENMYEIHSAYAPPAVIQDVGKPEARPSEYESCQIIDGSDEIMDDVDQIVDAADQLSDVATPSIPRALINDFDHWIHSSGLWPDDLDELMDEPDQPIDDWGCFISSDQPQSTTQGAEEHRGRRRRRDRSMSTDSKWRRKKRNRSPSSGTDTSEAETIKGGDTDISRVTTPIGNGAQADISPTANEPASSTPDRGSYADSEQSFESPTASVDTDNANMLLACPYCKWMPLTYRDCRKAVLREISRVKQHLWRYHQVPIHCAVCYTEFANSAERDEHLRQQNCVLRAAKRWDGITPEKRERLKKRVNTRLSKSEQWYEMFTILFPGAPLPDSPYQRLGISDEVSGFQDFIAEEWPSIFDDLVEKRFPSELRAKSNLVKWFSKGLFEETLSKILEKYEASHSGDGTWGHGKEPAVPRGS